MRRCILVLFGSLAAMFVALGVAAVPAGAHHAIISGTASCPSADHVIEWSIGNSQPKETMTILDATAKLGTTPYAVSGYSTVVAPAGTTGATTVVPGALTGVVTLWVHGEWSDGHTSSRHASVDLGTPCDATTTVPVSTTTVPNHSPSSTSGPSTSTSGSVPVATVPNPRTGGGSLAYTGARTDTLVGVGFGLVAAGLALWRPRRKTFVER